MRTISVLFSLLLYLLLGACPSLAQNWTTLTNSPPAGVSICLLLTDGSVLCEAGALNKQAAWYKLTPDSNGSYLSGTWSTAGSMPLGYAPDAAAEAVLADGRVVLIGGEYNSGAFVFTNMGAIYDPKADTWTMIAPPPFDHFVCIGDASLGPSHKALATIANVRCVRYGAGGGRYLAATRGGPWASVQNHWRTPLIINGSDGPRKGPEDTGRRAGMELPATSASDASPTPI